MIAAGLANGRVLLSSYSDNVNRITKEFVPRHPRACNALSWNPIYTNQLAAGLDKVRSDYSTFIWDVHQIGKTSSSTASSSTSSSSSSFVGNSNSNYTNSSKSAAGTSTSFNLLPNNISETVTR